MTVHAIHTSFDRDGNPHSDQKDRNSKEHYPKCVRRGAETLEEAAPSESFSSSWTCCTKARDSDLPFFLSQVLNVEKRIENAKEINRKRNGKAFIDREESHLCHLIKVHVKASLSCRCVFGAHCR